MNKTIDIIDYNPKRAEKTMFSSLNEFSIVRLFNIIKTYLTDHCLVCLFGVRLKPSDYKLR